MTFTNNSNKYRTRYGTLKWHRYGTQYYTVHNFNIATLLSIVIDRFNKIFRKHICDISM